MILFHSRIDFGPKVRPFKCQRPAQDPLVAFPIAAIRSYTQVKHRQQLSFLLTRLDRSSEELVAEAVATPNDFHDS